MELRNRLIVAYLFIAAVPILSIVTLECCGAHSLFQLGAYLLYEDIHRASKCSRISRNTSPSRIRCSRPAYRH